MLLLFKLGLALTSFVIVHSVSSLLTTTEAVVVEQANDDKEAAPSMGGAMGY